MARQINFHKLLEHGRELSSSQALGDARVRIAVLLVSLGCIPGSGLIFAMFCLVFLLVFFVVDFAYQLRRRPNGRTSQYSTNLVEKFVIRGISTDPKGKHFPEKHSSHFAPVIRNLSGSSTLDERTYSPSKIFYNVAGLCGAVTVLAARIALALQAAKMLP